MPSDKEDLPSTLERSAKKIQNTYEETLDSAEDQYDGDEARAHRTAWASVKNVAEKIGDHWELKDETGPSDPRSKQPQKRKREGKGETYGGIDVEQNSKADLVERAKKAGVTGYSRMTKADLAKALQRNQG
ncbi:ChaB family protein [uncultured Jatrophihabitans sp.]|uniref:ChaB family protein n=1 Tax=uncultured Jatrophihabitans sp. TaxID=1610747 RepID=UPI0035CBED04